MVFGIAMTSGLTMSALYGPGGAISGRFCSASLSSRICAQAVAAGDHTTGLVPFSSSSGQPCSSSVVASPDDLELTTTRMQSSAAAGVALTVADSAVTAHSASVITTATMFRLRFIGQPLHQLGAGVVHR